MKSKLLKLIVSAMVMITPLLIAANACSAVYGETEIPECLKTE